MIQQHALSDVHLNETLSNRLPILRGSGGLLLQVVCVEQMGSTVPVLMSSGCVGKRIERCVSNNHLVTVDILDYGAAAAKYTLTQLCCTLTQLG